MLYWQQLAGYSKVLGNGIPTSITNSMWEYVLIIRRWLSKRLRPLLLTTLVALLFILAGCILPGTNNLRDNANSTLTRVPTTIATCPTPSCGIAGVRPFINTSNDIHLFLTFDYSITNPAAIAKRYDYVWGAEAKNITAFRTAHPDIFLTYYISFFRESRTLNGDRTIHNLSYWKSIHPDWILYKCDRVTPAYEFGNANVPLDFANPAFVSWQTQTYAQPAASIGYDGIAADNVDLVNVPGACGTYVNGKWVQRYTGKLDDPRWRADVIKWLTLTQQALHHLQHPLALIANVSFGNLRWNDPQLQQAVSHLDGVLDESGFTNYGLSYLTGEAWMQRIQFIDSVQHNHKPYYIINQFPSVNQPQLQWALATYLMCKGQTTALYISTIQGYGSDNWYNEYNAQIGTQISSMYQAQNVYWRNYSNGKVIVNPSAEDTYTVNIGVPSRGQYIDLYGNHIGQTITLPPHSGMVLLHG